MDYGEQLDVFLEKHFPDLPLKSPLFYKARIAMRFELGGDLDVGDGREEQVYQRAITLFRAVNDGMDDLFVILFVDVWDKHPIREVEPRMRRILEKYVAHAERSEISRTGLEFRYREPDDEPDDTVTYRYCIKRKVAEVDVEGLLVGIANQEMGLYPKILGDLYLVNETNRTIFHLYDDRGLDLVADDVETIRNVYVEYYDWILDWDRKRMDEVFRER